MYKDNFTNCIQESGEKHIEFWWRSLKETDHVEDLGTDRRIITK
jgi:hypothetical protein